MTNNFTNIIITKNGGKFSSGTFIFFHPSLLNLIHISNKFDRLLKLQYYVLLASPSLVFYHLYKVPKFFLIWDLLDIQSIFLFTFYLFFTLQSLNIISKSILLLIIIGDEISINLFTHLLTKAQTIHHIHKEI